MEGRALKAAFGELLAAVARRRGDCVGALVAGALLVRLAPEAENPEAIRMIGAPLAVLGAIGAVLSICRGKGNDDD